MDWSKLDHALDWLKRVITQPRSELTRWQATVRYGYDLGWSGARQLRQDRAPQMAAALAFRTLFGLLPVLVLGTMLVRAFGGFGPFQRTLGGLFTSLGLDKIQVTTGGDASVDAAQTLDLWLLDLVGQVEDINLAAITWIGVAVLLYSAIGLMVTIESSFNIICRAPEGRSWARRIPIYWTLITMAPAALALTVVIDHWFDEFIVGAISWRWVLMVAPVLWSFAATWLVIFTVYKLLPNTRVAANPALVGAFVAAVLVEIGKRSMDAYLGNALSIRQLYGSLGLVPLFMFWVYLMWLVVLFGLEVTATLQMLEGRRVEDVRSTRGRTGLIDPASILSVMEVVAARFATSSATPARVITDETGIPESTVRAMLERLVEGGLLHRLDRDDGAVTLARPPEQISGDELIDIGFSLVDDGGLSGRAPILARLRDAQRTLAAGATLAQLLPAPSVAAGNDQAIPGA